jgi:uncharacterized protein YuzE
MEEVTMREFKKAVKEIKVFYDVEEDVLYLARPGQEEEVVEMGPGINLELDKDGNLLGVEIFNASHLLKDAIKLMGKRLKREPGDEVKDKGVEVP